MPVGTASQRTAERDSPPRPARSVSPFDRYRDTPKPEPKRKRGADARPRPGTAIDVFEPALLSMQELIAVLDHLGEPTSVVLNDVRGHEGVNPVEITKWFNRFNELDELQTHRGIAWCGYDAIRDSITRYMRWQDMCLDIQEQGGPRHPSQMQWDADGRGIRGAIGADSSEMVRTEILDDGTRKSFSVRLRLPKVEGVNVQLPWVRARMAEQKNPELDHIHDDTRAGRLTCSICNKSYDYNPERVNTRRLALGRVAKHLKMAKDYLSRHHALYAREFRK